LFFSLWVFVVVVVFSLNSGPTSSAIPPALLCDGFFQERVSWTICPGWLRTTILLISASWVARITGVSHQHPAIFIFCCF
jgi:hypothetical protein